MEKNITYYLLWNRVVGKKDSTGWYLYTDGRWQKDNENIITDHLYGYDPYEPEDSPYKMFNMSIMDEIQEISAEHVATIIGKQDICHEVKQYIIGSWGTDHILSVFVFDPSNIIEIDGIKKYNWRDSNPVYETEFFINDTRLRNYLEKTNNIESALGYPAASCNLLDRIALLELADTFPHIFSSLNRSALIEGQYLIVRSYWD